jgi:phenylalanyl-tRNA synthetase beta chain
MKYSYHWLKELSGTKKPADRVADLLMRHAFEVETVESYAHHLENIVTGEVLSVAPHPDADRLRVAQVEIGKYAVRQIVCGAPNLEAGQKVAVALPGAVLPNGIAIKESEIRGVQSEGMLCSEKELGLSENHEGIAVFHEEAPIGAEFSKYIGLHDTILDVKILADRGSDALSYEGLAREIAALDGHAPQFIETRAKPLKIPAYNRAPKIRITDKTGADKWKIIVLDSVMWYHHDGRIPGFEMQWLKAQLDAAAAAGQDIVVANHFAPYTPSFSGTRSIINDRELFALLRLYNVKLFLSGHEHGPWSGCTAPCDRGPPM